VLLNQLYDLITTTANSRKAVQKSYGSFKVEVSPHTLIHELVFHSFPELVILQIHTCSTFNGYIQSLPGLAIQGFNLIFNHGHDLVPELRSLLKFVHANYMEAVHNLAVSHPLPVFTIAKN